jgi:hypothetical protein
MRFLSELCIALVIGVGVSTVAQPPPMATRHKKTVLSRYGPPKKGSLLYRFTRELPEIDRIRISEIEPFRPDEWRPARKLKSVVLEGDEAGRFSEVWRRLHDGPNLGCFSPAYEVAFYSNNTLQLASQVCFHCQKVTLPDTDGLEEIPFDAEGWTGRALLKAIHRALRAGL